MKARVPRTAFATALLVSLSLAACVAEAPPAAEQGFAEDFAQEFCRFGSFQGSSSQGYECVDGEFHAWVDNDQEPCDFVTASAGETYGDVRIEADVRFAQGAEAGAYLICRGSQVTGSFYYFRLGADGMAEITDYLKGEEQLARMYSLPAGALQPGQNRMRADCVGNKLALHLNGQLVLEREIDGQAYGPGDIGLGAGGASEGLSDVYFDNLVVGSP
jgi:hypothetical protein